MTRPRRFSLLTSGGALLTAGLVIAIGATAASAATITSVTRVTGSAFGYGAFGISALGGLKKDYAETPVVSLNPTASNSPQAASAASGSVIYCPADLFTSGTISVRTTGSLGATGSVTTTSSLANVNASGQEPLTSSSVVGSCRATPSGTTGSTTVAGGSVVTNVDANGNPISTVPVPANPGPGFSIAGVVHPGGATDHFHYVFNEQSQSGGALIVNAVHEYLDGPLTTGSIIEGQVVCGLNATGVAAATTGRHSNAPGVGAALGPEGRVLSTALVSVGVALIAGSQLPWRRRVRPDRNGAGEPDDDPATAPD